MRRMRSRSARAERERPHRCRYADSDMNSPRRHDTSSASAFRSSSSSFSHRYETQQSAGRTERRLAAKTPVFDFKRRLGSSRRLFCRGRCGVSSCNMVEFLFA
jgi:hypothetical protein